MKVLFAVHDEKVSLSIVKKYQKEYKEIISYKNVYYFNAILKELQRDKTYDRIIIDEELEEFTSSSYEQKDKFIFDKLDNITDEASNVNGSDIPIILICSERRVKSEEILVKLFGIGIYNAIIGNDRSTDEVCRLINKPRTKKEAKIYYRIDSEDVSYRPETENDVSEEEMQYILSYFKKLGKNEERYVDCFRNIVSQYNEQQLKVIISILPLHVRSVLEENSPEYQRLVSKNDINYSPNKIPSRPIKKTPGTSEVLLTDKKKEVGKPIVVPSKMDKTLIKKITIKKPTTMAQFEENDEDDDLVNIDNLDETENINNFDDVNEIAQDEIKDLNEVNNDIQTNSVDRFEDFEDLEPVEEIVEEVQEQPRRRGRPRKNPIVEPDPNTQPKRRGRPRKNPLPEIAQLDVTQNEEDEEEYDNMVLPGFQDVEEEKYYENENSLSDVQIENDDNSFEEDSEFLPGFGDEEVDEDEEISDLNSVNNRNVVSEINEVRNEPVENKFSFQKKELPKFEQNYDYDYSEYQSLLSGDKKVVAFVGTSKNGTSFMVNNIAKVLADSGVDTAILDATENKNSYYIFTNNEEELRQKASNCIGNLISGVADGISAGNNLTVYTEIPSQESSIENVGPILENLVKRHSAIIIDCDFNTPIDYFENAQEIYLIQSMDVLTIQPLTAFLRDLKTKNIINERKLKIILNKIVKVRGVNAKVILGGMSKYNDPEMNFMTDLFNRDSVTSVAVPFYVDVYEKYLEQIINCEIRNDGYSKEFMNILKNIASMVYPLLPEKNSKGKPKKGYQYDINSNNYSNNGFSNSVNNTLNNMKKKY